MKRCTKCGLSVDEGAVFTKDKQKIDGLNCSCKKCRSEYAKQHYCSENGREARKRYLLSDKRIKSLKKHQQTDRYKELQKRYRRTEKFKETQKRYRQSEDGLKKRKAYIQLERVKAARKKHRQTEQYKETIRKYLQSDRTKEMIKGYYQKNKVSRCISTAINRSLKSNKNGRHWEDVLGWTLQQFKRRFVQLFKTGMAWENHGTVWEIDHIVPLSVHNITSIECTDFKRAWRLSNLQPLFKVENNSKYNKLEKHFQPTLF